MSDLRLGQILDETAGRDAIHVAIAPVIAAQSLGAGQRVRLDDDGRAVPAEENSVGVIDPFLARGVDSGQRCWLFLNPGTITSLRHVWTHPLFDAVSSTHGEAEMRLRSFAEQLGLSYSGMLSAARDYQESEGERYLVSWSYEGEWIYDGFWSDYEAVTGARAKETGAFFSCGGCS